MITLGIAAGLWGMSAWGQQTNSVPQKIRSSNPPAQTQKTTAKPTVNRDSRELTRTNALPPMNIARRTLKDRLFGPQKVDNYNAEVNQIFFPGSDEVGNTMVRDTVVTIYPPGR